MGAGACQYISLPHDMVRAVRAKKSDMVKKSFGVGGLSAMIVYMDITRSGLYTDFYELTMAQGYFCSGKKDARATFDLYFRSAPFGGGYAVFAGLQQAIESVLAFSYSGDELAYLKGLGFRADFLDWLGQFRFTGDIDAFREGDIVFPDDVLMRVSAPIIEAQLLESMLLNIINFQTLIATKTMRIVSAARGRAVMDFGLRRAQAEASMAASRAAYIGGTAGTSHTLAARTYGIPAIGTHAHSWIQSFDSEYTAFSTYARLYPQTTTLLVDTYDTLSSGVPNAIRVAREMERPRRAPAGHTPRFRRYGLSEQKGPRHA